MVSKLSSDHSGYWAIWQVLAQVCGVLSDPKARVIASAITCHIALNNVLLVCLRINFHWLIPLGYITQEIWRNSYSVQHRKFYC